MILTMSAMTAQTAVDIRRAHDISYDGSAVELPDGGLLSVYLDTKYDNHDLFAQRFSATGEVLWTEPVEVAVKPRPIVSPAATLCSDGGYVIAWFEHDGLLSTVHAQKLSSQGEIQWQTDGVEVFGSHLGLQYIRLVANSSGGAYLVAQSPVSEYCSSIWGANLDSQGQNLWQDGGQAIITHTAQIWLRQAVTDGVGGLVINTRKNVGGTNWEVYVRRIGPDAMPLGPDPLIVDSGFAGDYFNLQRCGDGNYLVFGNSTTSGYIRFNKFNNQGQSVMPSAVQHAFQGSIYTYNVAADGSLFIGWATISSGAYYFNVQKFSPSYAPLWQPVASQFMSGGYNNPGKLQADDLGGCYYAWAGIYESGQPRQVRCQRFDASGSAVFGNDALLMSPVSVSGQPALHLLSDGMMMLWTDVEEGLINLRRQVIGPAGSLVFLPEQTKLVSRLFGRSAVKSSLSIPGGYLLVWDDYRDYPYSSVYYQKTGYDLQPLYEDSGRLLAGGPTSYNVWEACANDIGEVLVAFRSSENNGNNCYIQIIGTDGQPFYVENGIQISPEARQVNVSSSGSDFYISWVSKDDVGYDLLMGQRVSGGLPMWEPEGRLIKDTNYTNRITGMDLKRGYFIWEEYSNMDYNYKLVKALRLEPDGSVSAGWEPAGKIVAAQTTASNQFLVWTDLIGDDLVALVASNLPPRVQRITPGGTKLWGIGTIVMNTASFGVFNVSADLGDGISIVFPFYNDTTYTHSYRLQRVNLNGEILCGAGGQLLLDGIQNAYSPYLLDRGQGELSLLVRDPRIGYSSNTLYDLVHYPVNAQGELGSGVPMGLLLEGTAAVKSAKSTGSAIIAYDQVSFHNQSTFTHNKSVDAIQLPAPPSGSSDEFQSPAVLISKLKAQPNPFKTGTRISFELSTAEEPELRVYNLRGQLVRKIGNQQVLSAGSQNLEWDGTDQSGKQLPSGIYLIKVRAGSSARTAKILKQK